MEIHTLGIDLGKTIFHLVGLNAAGEVVLRKKCSPPVREALSHPPFGPSNRFVLSQDASCPPLQAPTARS